MTTRIDTTEILKALEAGPLTYMLLAYALGYHRSDERPREVRIKPTWWASFWHGECERVEVRKPEDPIGDALREALADMVSVGQLVRHGDDAWALPGPACVYCKGTGRAPTASAAEAGDGKARCDATH